MGTLEVQLSNGTDSDWELAWTLTGNQGNYWHRATVSLKEDTKKLRFMGTTGGDYESDMAIDDFLARGGPAPSPAPTVPPTLVPTPLTPVPTNVPSAPSVEPTISQAPVPSPTLPPTPVPTPSSTPLPTRLSPLPTIAPTGTPTSTPTYPREVCDFDTSECGFSDNGGRDWVRHSGPTPSYPQTGPGSDHTSGYGSYMFVESSSPNSPNVGPFVLQTDLSEGVSYVDFWYHMYGFASKFVYPFYEHKPGK